MPRLGELLLWGWLWNLTWGGYYLIIVMLASWIILMRNKVAIFSSLILALLTTLCALILYSATMAVVDFLNPSCLSIIPMQNLLNPGFLGVLFLCCFLYCKQSAFCSCVIVTNYRLT